VVIFSIIFIQIEGSQGRTTQQPPLCYNAIRQ